MPTHQAVQTKLDEIQAEMKRIGMWEMPQPTPDQLVITQAFGGDKLAFEQWLRFVFVPRVQEIIAEKGAFPSKSEVAGQAFREWSMYGSRPDVEPLLGILREFDDLF